MRQLYYQRYFICFGVILTLVFLWAMPARAQFNEQINYQGRLLDATGSAVVDGTYAMSFRLYTVATSGSAIWTETLSGVNEVTVIDGLFSVMLGSTSPLTGVDFNQTLYLGVTIESDSEMTPRKILGAVPAAFVAKEALDANAVGGVASSSLLRSDDADTMSASSSSAILTVIQQGLGKVASFFSGVTEVFTILNNGNVGVGTSTPSSRFAVAGNAVIGGDLTATGTLSVGSLSGLLLGTNGLVSAVATSTLNLDLANTVGILGATRGGTGLSSITQNQLLIGGAGNTWAQIATSSLGLGDGTFIGLPDTPATYTANRLFYTNSGATAVTDSANLTFDGSQLATLNLAVAGTSTFVGTTTMATSSITGMLFIGTTTLSSSVTSGLYLEDESIGLKNTANFSRTGTVSMDTSGYLIINSTTITRLNNSSQQILETQANTGATFNPTQANNLDFHIYGDFNTDFFVADVGLERIGIGTTTPTAKLTVVGNTLITGTSTLATTTITDLALTNALALTSGGTGATSAAGARTNLGATTVGSNIFTLTNPSSSTLLKLNADNTVSAIATSTLNLDLANTVGILGATRGGTGLSSYATGDLIYASGANTLTNRTIGTTGDVLSVVGGVPTWVATSTLGISGGGPSLFTDGGVTTYLTSLTDRLAVGSTTANATLDVYGDFRVGTQTEPILLVQTREGRPSIAIGTSTPVRDFELYSSLSGGAVMRIDEPNPRIELYENDATANNRLWRMQASSGVWSLALQSDALGTPNTAFSVGRSGATPISFFTDDLRFGINDNDPDFRLEVAGSATNGFFALSSVLSADGDVFRVNANGAVAVGTTTSNAFYTIATSTASTTLAVRQFGVGTIFEAFDGGVSAFTIIDGGNVGIGTSSPTAKLTVVGTTLITGTSTLATTTITDLAVSSALRDASGSAGTSGMVLQSTGTSTQWVATSTLGITGGSGATTLSALTDVSLAGLATGQLLSYNGSVWNNVATSTLNLDLANTVGILGATRGGTGLSSYATGDLIYASGANTLANRTIGATGDVLSVVGGVPTWVATSTLGISGGSGATTFLALTDTPSSYTANRLFYTNSGATAVTDSANLTFDGSQLATLNLAVAGTSTFVGTTTMASTSISGTLQMGTTSLASRFMLDVNNFSAAGIAGLNRYYTSTNAASGTVQFGELAYIKNSATATTTFVGSMFRVEDNTTFGNTIRGLEVQTNRGTNTQGENTALSGFARTFGVRGFTSADAGGRFEPAGGYFETGGTAQGNAIRGYSSSITSANLMALFQDTSTFTGTGLAIDLGNGTGSFTGKFIDLKVGGATRFSVASTGTLFTQGDVSIVTTNTDPAANNVVGMYFGANGFASINRSANVAMNLGRSNDGAVLQFYSAGAVQGSVSIAGATVSYNAFTGSHFGLVASSSYDKGTLLELTGENSYYNNDETSEIVYGMQKTTTENSDRVIGAYLASLEPSKPQSTSNPTLVMAVGNGHMWVADQGEDIKAGDYLIASNVTGHAEKDNQTAPVSYIIARASEDIMWDDVETAVDGVKHKRITVFFENFTRPNIDVASIASTAVGLSAVPEESFTHAFLTGLFTKIATWIGDAQNGIGAMYAEVFNASERVCIDGECLTAEDIRELKNALQGGGSNNPPGTRGEATTGDSSGDGDTNSSDEGETTSEPDSGTSNSEDGSSDGVSANDIPSGSEGENQSSSGDTNSSDEGETTSEPDSGTSNSEDGSSGA